MSGHSKWKQIKHKKGAADAARGKIFTKLANAITVAAKSGGGDPAMNFKLRLAIDAARAANMPKDNIERAIRRGTGELGGTLLEEVIYEGYGPGGVAIMVRALTDNRNRTISSLRSIFSKNNGSLAESGAVSYLFEQKGLIKIELPGNLTQDQEQELELKIIETGAEDIKEFKKVFEIYTQPQDLEKVKKNIEELGQKIISAELVFEPKTLIKIEDESMAQKVISLMDQLEEHDDVEQAYSNFDISEEILNRI